MPRRLAAVLLPLLFLAPASLSAQSRTTAIRGTVVDSTGQPVADAEVTLGLGGAAVRTDALGRYRIEDPPGGAHWVFVRRVGFAPTRRTVRVKQDAVTPLDFTLVPTTLTLAEFIVEAVEDWRRARSSVGSIFLAQEDLAAGNRTEVSETVRLYLPYGVFRESGPDALDRAGLEGLNLVQAGGSLRCAPAVSYNGERPRNGFPVDAFPLSEVEAVEVYRPGQSRVPWEFADLRRAVACGTVVVWLKH